VKKIILLVAAVMLSAGAGRAAAQSGRYVVIVNPRNPATALSASELSRIYLGQLQAWRINGKIEPVNAVDQKPDSPVRTAFTERVLHRSVTEVASYWRQEIYAGRNFPPLEQSEEEAIASVREVLGAIAYVSTNADLSGVKVLRVQ
jgi:ABC-type phosphate transport system substrate-binding protein